MNLDHAKEHLKRIIRAEFDERDTDLVNFYKFRAMLISGVWQEKRAV